MGKEERDKGEKERKGHENIFGQIFLEKNRLGLGLLWVSMGLGLGLVSWP